VTIDREAIRAREAAATPGPWGVPEEHRPWLSPQTLYINGNYPHVELEDSEQGLADLEFIHHARTDIPALLAENKALRTQLDRANAKALEMLGRQLGDVERLTAERNRLAAGIAELVAMFDPSAKRGDERYLIEDAAIKVHALAGLPDPYVGDLASNEDAVAPVPSWGKAQP
jgi:hypothetical protein